MKHRPPVVSGSAAPDGTPVEVLDAGAVGRPPAAGFAGLVAPLAPEEFIDTRYLDKRPVLFRGWRERFSALIDWEVLRTLMSNGPDHTRIALFRDDVAVPLSHCLAPQFGHGWRATARSHGGRLDDRRLTSLLREGVTLVLRGVHDLHPPAGALANDIEAALKSYAGVNLYASWKEVRGFGAHWDDHDAFIVQVAGCKHWHLYGETRRSPMTLDVAPSLDAPPDVVWSETLWAGDVLYIPRGWWHDARVDGAAGGEGVGSLHLTCSVDAITAVDLMHWLAGELARHEVFRRDLPLRPSSGAGRAHFAALRELIVSALDAEVGEAFWEHMRLAWSERRGSTLGSCIEPWKSPLWDRCRLRLYGVRRAALAPRRDADTVVLEADGYAWTFDRRCLDLLSPLVETGEVSVGELKRVAPERFAAAFVDDFARMLIEEGVAYPVLPDRE